MGFLHSSVGKESACNAGDPGSIPGLGRSPEEGIGYPLQCFGAFLVAKLVKNLPAMQETPIRALGWEDPLEKGKATHFSILAWRVPWTIWSLGSQGVGHDWATFTFTFILKDLTYHPKSRQWKSSPGHYPQSYQQRRFYCSWLNWIVQRDGYYVLPMVISPTTGRISV